MEKIIYTVLLFCVLSICSNMQLVAQVTVGISEMPAQGALLQLKNIESVSDGEANSTKGLGLPRVHLTSAKSLAPILENADDATNLAHTGLMVYASDDFGRVPTYCEGLYVWNGAQWQPLSEKGVVSNGITAGLSYTTDIEGNKYYYKRFGNTDWMISNLRTTKKADGTSIATTDKPIYMNHAKRSGELVSTELTPPVVVLQRSDLENTTKTVTFKENSISVSYSYSQFATIFGLLYTYEQAQDACPQGWRLPLQADMKELGNVLGVEYFDGIYPGGVGSTNIGYIKNAKQFRANDWDYTPGDKNFVYQWGGYSLCSTSNAGIHFVPSGYVRLSNGEPDARQFGRETFMHYGDVNANPARHSYMVLDADNDFIIFREAGIAAEHSLPIRCVRNAN